MDESKPAAAEAGCCEKKSRCCGPGAAPDWIIAIFAVVFPAVTLAAWSAKVMPALLQFMAAKGHEMDGVAQGLHDWVIRPPWLLISLGPALFSVWLARRCCGRCGARMLTTYGLILACAALTALFFTGVNLAQSLP